MSTKHTFSFSSVKGALLDILYYKDVYLKKRPFRKLNENIYLEDKLTGIN